MVFFRLLYKRVKICYTVHMNIFKRLQNSLSRHLYERRKKKYGVYFPYACLVCGVTREDRQGALAQSKAGDQLQIVHRARKYDKNSVYVYSITLNRILGRLHQDVARTLIKLFKKGFCKDGVLVERLEKSEKYPYYGCKIAVFESMKMMNDCKDFSPLHGE